MNTYRLVALVVCAGGLSGCCARSGQSPGALESPIAPISAISLRAAHVETLRAKNRLLCEIAMANAQMAMANTRTLVSLCREG